MLYLNVSEKQCFKNNLFYSKVFFLKNNPQTVDSKLYLPDIKLHPSMLTVRQTVLHFEPYSTWSAMEILSGRTKKRK